MVIFTLMHFVLSVSRQKLHVAMHDDAMHDALYSFEVEKKEKQ